MRRIIKSKTLPQRYWIAFVLNNKRYVLAIPYNTDYDANEKGFSKISGAVNAMVVPLKTSDSKIAAKMLKAEIVRDADEIGDTGGERKRGWFR